jgi:hypothetical protein
MFELASRIDLRFPSTRGNLLPSDLWRLQLKSKVKANVTLDTLAQAEDQKIRESQASVSFVDQNMSSQSTEVKDSMLRLDILKHIIGVRLKDQQEEENKRTNKKEMQELAALIDDKKKEAKKDLTIEELEAQMRKLSNK